VVAAMCERASRDRMVLSHDASSFMDWLDEGVIRATMPRWNFATSPPTCFPALGSSGSPRLRSVRCWSTTPAAIFDAGVPC